MKRVQLFEFEDFHGFPAWIRTSMTNLLMVLHKMIKSEEVIVKLLSDVRQKVKFQQIVDLGSGSGGVMPNVVKHLNNEQQADIKLVLSDLHPNPQLVESFNASNEDNISYTPQPIDATDLSHSPEGLKTMMNSFHHIDPQDAHRILASAKQAKQPILIYEMGDNKIPLPIWALLLPLSLVIMMIMVLFMTPFTRPISIKQLLFTYIIPVIPFCYAWDGQASTVRMYTFEDIKMLMKGIESDEEYVWEVKYAKRPNGKKFGYYILGMPK